jgi:hypothetical protein
MSEVMRMRYSHRVLLSLCVAMLSAVVVIYALRWPYKAAVFPVLVGIFTFSMSIAETLLSLFDKGTGEKLTSMDFDLSEGIDPALEIHRIWMVSIWIVSFFLMILLLGFNIAVPLWVFLYLKIHGKEKWVFSIVLTALTWICFYGLFIKLSKTIFEEGWLLGIFGI